PSLDLSGCCSVQIRTLPPLEPSRSTHQIPHIPTGVSRSWSPANGALLFVDLRAVGATLSRRRSTGDWTDWWAGRTRTCDLTVMSGDARSLKGRCRLTTPRSLIRGTRGLVLSVLPSASCLLDVVLL